MSADPEVKLQQPLRRNKSTNVGSAFLTIGSSEGFAQVLRLIRGIIVARVLGPDMMGIAFSMLIINDFIERLVFFSPATTLVQDQKGSSKRFRHSLQLFLLLRGIFFASVALVLAWPLAWLSSLDEPIYLAGFFVVAAIPLIRNSVHVDVFRQLRNKNYKPVAILAISPPAVSLIAVIPLSLVIQNFWLPIILFLINSTTAVVVSSLLAKRKRGFLFDRESFRRILKFAIPLIGAGIVIFFTLQGPRLLIQSAPRLFDQQSFTMADVGRFGIAMTLCLLPVAVGSRILATTWEPQLARLRDNQAQFRQVFVEMQSISYTLGIALMFLLGFGSTWVIIIYDSSYAAAGPLVSVLSIFAGLRLGRVAMRSAALSTGRSSIIFLANAAGLIGLSGAVVVVLLGRPLVEITICLVIGEIASFIAGNIPLMFGPLALRARDLWIRPIVFSVIGILGAYCERTFIPEMPLVLTAIISVVLAVLVVLVCAALIPQVRAFCLSLIPSKKD